MSTNPAGLLVTVTVSRTLNSILPFAKGINVAVWSGSDEPFSLFYDDVQGAL